MIKIIAHRGAWSEPSQKNSLESVEKAFQLFDGVEIDVRDYCGELVVSHDPANSFSVPLMEYFHLKNAKDKIWALNIKADGLSRCLAHLLKEYQIKSYFCFDMSIPETMRYFSDGLAVFMGVNDVMETGTIIRNSSSGAWLDSFSNHLWYDEKSLLKIFQNFPRVCIVSEELHGRSPKKQWELIKKTHSQKFQDNEYGITLCTDIPEKARSFFYD